MAASQSVPSPKWEQVPFQADSALLRELGELLVGQAHIALAELVKNAYDADATRCRITIAEDEITVEDNGHGMSREEFLQHWMTIGTRHKQEIGTSRRFKRQVTGSKGVGRLAAQFLAHDLEITTVPAVAPSRELIAKVDWDDAIEKGHLTEAQARYRTQRRTASFPKKWPHGTRILLKDLKQPWAADEIRELGRQIWMIQSPIARYGRIAGKKEAPDDFRVALRSPLRGLEDAFQSQMDAALENYIAKITGELTRNGRMASALVKVSFRSGEQYSEQFDVAPVVADANWEIRVFNLAHRQAGGVSVKDARDYFEHFGGVLVYDGTLLSH